MVIEKKYYDIAQHELEEMQREINEEKAQMSEEEILEDKNGMMNNWKQLLKRQKLICVVLRKFQILKSSEIHFFTKRCIGNCTKYADEYKN